MSINELGAFLRARREAVSPAEVGLPAGSRRRTPGLRRSELATLAGVSVEYLARLEQGRDRNPSPQVVDALVEALRLSVDDRLQLRNLIKSGFRKPCVATETPRSDVRPTVRMLLDRLEPTPAVVINRLSDVLAHTDAYGRLMGPTGLLDGPAANLVRYALTDPRAHTAYPDWAAVADARVGSLRLVPKHTDPHLTRLADELSVLAGAAFASRRNKSTPPSTGNERLRHPVVGELNLAYEVMALPDPDGQQLIVYLPADEQTSTRLDGLLRTGPTALPRLAVTEGATARLA